VLKTSFAWIALAAVGGGLGAFIILYGYPFPTDTASQTFVRQPSFLLWLFFIITLTALLALLAGPLWLSLRPLQAYFKRGRLDIIMSTILTLALLCVPIPVARLLAPIPTPDLQYHSTKIAIILLLALMTVTPGVVGILLVRAGTQAAHAELMAEAPPLDFVDMIRKHLRLRDTLQQYLAVLGLLVGLVTLTTGALRNVQIASGVSEEDYPLTVVLIFGLYYTALLALLYAPTYLALGEAGRTLRDRAFPFSSLDNLAEDTKKRMQLEELLQLNIRTEQSLRAGIAILAPLLTSLVSVFLGIKL
jgi:hypothetical protein